MGRLTDPEKEECPEAFRDRGLTKLLVDPFERLLVGAEGVVDGHDQEHDLVLSLGFRALV